MIALPPERVMSALAPLAEPAPSIQPAAPNELPIVPFEERPGIRKRPLYTVNG